MATNIITIFDPIDTFNGQSGGNALAITDPLDTIALNPGLQIAITDSLDTASIHGIAEPNFLKIEDPADVFAVHALTGEIGQIAIEDHLDTFAGQGYSGVLGTFSSLQDPLDQMQITGLSGVIGEIALVNPLDTFAIEELPSNHGILAITDPLDFISLYGRVIPITYIRKAVVMHLFNHAVTEYQNFNFNSLAHFGDVFLGANENGLYILGGKDDLGQPIQADVRTGIHDFASDGIMKLPKEAWLSYRTDGQLELGIEVEEDRDPYPYVFERTHSNRITEIRETLGKGLAERFYTFIIKNLSGSDFDLSSFRILGNIINRKRR